MTTQSSIIICPHCNSEINIEEALYSQLKLKFERDMNKERKRYKEVMKDLNNQKEELRNKEIEFNAKLQNAVNRKLQEDRVKLQEQLAKEIRASIAAENSLHLKQLQEELQEKSKQVQELNATKATIAKLQREKDEIASKIKADSAIELNKQLELEKQKLQKEAEEAHALKLREKDEQLDQIKKQLDDAKRKAEQGSMQIQGEVQERSIEEYLLSKFKYDTVEEISKGAFGADCIQTINTLDFQNCAKICYESKNTKSFGKDWIAKLKHDMVEAGADVGVLVTSVYPKDMDRMGFMDGIWICSYDEFKGSVALIREGLIGIYKATLSQENRADKMSLLYSYFTSSEFSMQLNAIVDGFIQMQEELNKQKRSVMASWKRQQKQIDTVLLNTTSMYGSIKGIAGNAIEHVAALELEYMDENEEDE